MLGHALAMKAIHGGKAKNDKIDSRKIASLLRGGVLPQAYVYPAAMRSTRDLLRRRLHLVRKRGESLNSGTIRPRSACVLRACIKPRTVRFAGTRRLFPWTRAFNSSNQVRMHVELNANISAAWRIPPWLA